MQDYRRATDYLRPPSAAAIALSDRYADYRTSTRASRPSKLGPQHAGWWESAVVLRAAVALGLGTFVSSIGNAGLGAPWTELLMQTACARHNVTYPSSECNQLPAAQSEAAWRQEWINLGTTIPQFLTVGIIAQMADSFGRKPAILVGVISSIAYPLSVAIIPFGELCLGSFCTDGFWLLLAVNIVSSFSGGGAACWAIQMTVMSDVSGSWSVKQRTMAFMLLEAAGAAGPIVGPVLGATLAERYDLRMPFWFCSVTCIFQALLMLLCLKETLPPEDRKCFSMRDSSPWRQMAAFFDHRIMVCFFVLIGPTAGLGGSVGVINNLYLMRVVDYTIMQLSYLTTFGTTIGIIGMIGGLPLLQRWLRNRSIMIVCAITGTAQTFAFAVLAWPKLWDGLKLPHWRVWMPYLTQLGGITGSMMMPCLRSTIAALGESGESQYSVAVLLGAIGAEQTLFSIIGPAVWPPIWAWTESSSPALSFYIATVLAAGGIAACVALPPLETVETKAAAKALEKLSLQGSAGTISTGKSATIDEPSFDYQYMRSRRLSSSADSQRQSDALARPLLGSVGTGAVYKPLDASIEIDAGPDGVGAKPLDSGPPPATAAISDYRKEAMVARAASNEEAGRVVRADIERAQRLGRSYEQFRAEYRPTGGDQSLRQLWDVQQQKQQQQQHTSDTRTRRLSDVHTLDMLRQLDAAATAKANASRSR